MKLAALVTAVLVGSSCTPAAAQIKVEDVEIWGLPAGKTSQSFVDELNRKKETVCMAAIRPMGYQQANVIGMENIRLVTLRATTTPVCAKKSAPNLTVLRQLDATFPIKQLHTMEFQRALSSLYATRAKDTAAISAVRKRFARANDLTYQALTRQLNAPNQLTLPQCLAVLCSTAADTVREKALVQVAAKLQTVSDAHQLVPYMQDPEIGYLAMQAVRGFFKYHTVAPAAWPAVMNTYVRTLNAPDPTVTLTLAAILAQQQVPRSYATPLLQSGSITMREILLAQHPDLTMFKQQLYPLLSYLSATDIRTEQAALAYLSKFQK